jgi:iron complex outermembrane receptor protein
MSPVRRVACAMALWATVQGAQADGLPGEGVSERDYFAELPVVLSVSRLAQPLNEVPGAVTVIDRDLIRRSGARELAEVLRLVPGFLLTYRNGANPQAAYHAGMDVYGSRMQVYVDGRSLYSSFYLGDTHVALRGLALEDIERIEVLRGSNSASYGANAFLGVVNIVTLNSADTHGTMVSLSNGDQHIRDRVVRHGWGNKETSFRISASTRADRGLDGVFDDSRVSRIQLRADLSPTARDEVMLQLGASSIERGDGVGTGTNPFRSIGNAEAHLHLRWQHQLAADQELQLRFVHELERPRDRFIAVSGVISAVADSGGWGTRTEFGLQHSLRVSPALRLAWGGELSRATASSRSVFFTDDSISMHQWRTFANFEWRPQEQWLLQAGGTYEGHSYTGGSFSPRLSANFHITPAHTLRAGVTRSVRAPTFYELRGDTRLFNLTPGVPGVPVGSLASWTFLSSGTVKPETMITHEVGYLGRLHAIGLGIDARAFVERMNKRIWFESRSVPGWTAKVNDAINRPGPYIHGFEYQFDWRPLPATRLMLAESHIRIQRGDAAETREAPFRNTTVTWLQELPAGFDLSLIASDSTPYQWAGGGDLLTRARRLDLRLAKAFKFGVNRGEASVTTQAIDGAYPVFKASQRFDRRAFANLRLDF